MLILNKNYKTLLLTQKYILVNTFYSTTTNYNILVKDAIEEEEVT